MIDSRGRTVFVDSGDLPNPFDRSAADTSRFGQDLTKTIPSTVRFPADCFVHARPSIDLRRIRSIVIRLNRPSTKAIAFDQLQVVTL